MNKLSDPNWRVENLYKIIDKNGNRITFKRNPIQKLIAFNPALRKTILKARQFGVSTERLITKFDATIFRPNTTTAIIAHEDDAVEKLFRIVSRALRFMPEELKPIIDRGGGSKNELYFPEINSRIYCDLEIRGDTVQILHVSEAAFMKDSSKLKATLQAVPLNGIVDIETTANGMANYFYELWNDPDQPYAKIFIPWYMFPDYKMPAASNMQLTENELELKTKAMRLFGIQISNEQIAFRRLKKAELKESAYDKKKVTFEQEYPEDDVTCFLSSGASVMDLFILKDLIENARKPIIDSGWFQVYEKHNRAHVYVCGADTAEGTGGDYSVGVMIDINTKEVVAKIKGHWKPHEFAHRLKDLCLKYKSSENGFPELAVERNNHGHAVLLELSEHIGYANLYQHTDEKLGWRTDSITRPIMINAFINALENKYIKVQDMDILNECLTLINVNGKIEAADNKHDDCVIATAIAIQMALKGGNLEVYNDISKKIYL